MTLPPGSHTAVAVSCRSRGVAMAKSQGHETWKISFVLLGFLVIQFLSKVVARPLNEIANMIVQSLRPEDNARQENERYDLQRELAELRIDMDDLKHDHRCLKERLDAIEKALCELPGSNEALSILKAAESRILKKVLVGARIDDVRYYVSVRLLVEDEAEGLLPKSISTKWQRFKPVWNPKVMSRVYDRLRDTSGVVCPREDADRHDYESMPLTRLRQLISSYGFRTTELKAIELVHSATLGPREPSPIGVSDTHRRHVALLHLGDAAYHGPEPARHVTNDSLDSLRTESLVYPIARSL